MTPDWKQMTMVAALAALVVALTACSSGNKSSESAKEEEASPEEKKFVAAAEPFVKAIAARNYAAAYVQLSSHARARMSLNQFVPEENDAAYAKNESQPRMNVSAEEFAQLMKGVEMKHGQPGSVREIHLFEADPKVLSGQGEKLEKLEVMFAIGAMPASIPADIRRASVRCQIKTTLSPEQLKQAAKDLRTTAAELQKDPDFQPYFNLKVVLVEEAGALRVGYFEFLPPSMLD
jgi:hypothetical protein